MRETVLLGDAIDVLSGLDDGSVQTCVTSPPYWGLRDYGHAGQIGLEKTPEEYVQKLVDVFREVRRVLRDDATLWLNLGDSYAQAGGPGWQGKNGQRADRRFTAVRDTVGLRETSRRVPHGIKPKDLVGVPWRVAFALQADGWYLRSDIIWAKPNAMPESVTDRPTKSHEYVFLLSKSPRYYFGAAAISEGMASGPSDIRKMTEQRERVGGLLKAATSPLMKASARTNIGQKRSVGNPDNGRNARSVWTIATQPYPEAHFATFPEALAERCILAGSRPGDVVLDPFAGSGTTLAVAQKLGRGFIGIELNETYHDLIRKRLRQAQPPLIAAGAGDGATA